jgi:peroxiredoxin Q/BCP
MYRCARTAHYSRHSRIFCQILSHPFWSFPMLRSPLAALILVVGWTAWTSAADKPPAVGDSAADFALPLVDGTELKLSELRKQGPVVLVVLRGYPGYQCPICNAQAGEFLAQAQKFAAAKAQVVFVYPGKADGLKQHAAEFLKNKSLPAGFHFTIDPGLKFIASYALRWEKPGETAYPATFVIGPGGQIRYALISQSHGGRAKAAAVLAALEQP